MEIKLDPVETRVLGVLAEKQITTPEYYPLSLNAATNACNQKSNREPVLELSEDEVQRSLDSLRRKELVWQIETSGSRVAKYQHRMAEKWHLERQEIAVLSELFLRGPQTPGELRSRAGRMHPFSELAEVEKVLDYLASREDGPFVVKLERQPGRREARYAHTFSETESFETDSSGRKLYLRKRETIEESIRQREGVQTGSEDRERITLLEDRVSALEEAFESLRQELRK